MGSYGYGTVFKIDAAGRLTTLHSFTTSEGDSPYGGLIQASDGSFYGTARNDGAAGYGIVFKIDPAGTLTTLHSFTWADGAFPCAGLIQATDGSFYGTTRQGNLTRTGTIFKIDAAGTLTTLHGLIGGEYSGYPEGSYPVAGLIQASDGSFYGTTADGGPNNGGVVFRLTVADDDSPVVADVSYSITSISVLTVVDAVGMEYCI